MVLGHLFVVAAPSGAGKTTLVKALVETLTDVTVSISHTTRPKRPNEVEGVNYHFISKETFNDMVRHNDFLEHATIFQHYYGTSKKWVEATLSKGTDVILEIDWQGHQQIKQLFHDCTSIFILPPSRESLRERLVTRNQDNPTIIEERLADAKQTLSHMPEFDYIVINDGFDKAVDDLALIILSTRLRTRQQIARHPDLIKNFTY